MSLWHFFTRHRDALAPALPQRPRPPEERQRIARTALTPAQREERTHAIAEMARQSIDRATNDLYTELRFMRGRVRAIEGWHDRRDNYEAIRTRPDRADRTPDRGYDR